VIRRTLERFVVDEEIRRGYKHIYTPELANIDLYKTSGHYPYYKDTMYPLMKVDEEELMLRPMTCPHHSSIMPANRVLTVNCLSELPSWPSSSATKKSGELTGLMRVRLFCLADAHISVRESRPATK